MLPRCVWLIELVVCDGLYRSLCDMGALQHRAFYHLLSTSRPIPLCSMEIERSIRVHGLYTWLRTVVCGQNIMHITELCLVLLRRVIRRDCAHFSTTQKLGSGAVGGWSMQKYVCMIKYKCYNFVPSSLANRSHEKRLQTIAWT